MLPDLLHNSSSNCSEGCPVSPGILHGFIQKFIRSFCHTSTGKYSRAPLGVLLSSFANSSTVDLGVTPEFLREFLRSSSTHTFKVPSAISPMFLCSSGEIIYSELRREFLQILFRSSFEASTLLPEFPSDFFRSTIIVPSGISSRVPSWILLADLPELLLQFYQEWSQEFFRKPPEIPPEVPPKSFSRDPQWILVEDPVRNFPGVPSKFLS